MYWNTIAFGKITLLVAMVTRFISGYSYDCTKVAWPTAEYVPTSNQWSENNPVRTSQGAFFALAQLARQHHVHIATTLLTRSVSVPVVQNRYMPPRIHNR